MLQLLDNSDDDFVLCESPKIKSPKQARGIKRKRKKVVRPKLLTGIKAKKHDSEKVKTDGPLCNLFHKQKQTRNSFPIEIILSDDSSDFVNTNRAKDQMKLTDVKCSPSESAQEPVFSSWLNVARSLVQEDLGGAISKEAYMCPSVSNECLMPIDPSVKSDEPDLPLPSSPVLFSDDSNELPNNRDSIEIKQRDQMDPFRGTGGDPQEDVHATNPVLAVPLDSEYSKNIMEQGTNEDVHTTNPVRAIPLDSESAKTKMNDISVGCKEIEKSVVVDGVKKQATITSFFGSKPVKTFVREDVKVRASVAPFFGVKTFVSKAVEVRTSGKMFSKNVETDVTENVTYPGSRSCPFYKRINGTKFAVDAFSYGSIPGVEHYFLTHFHADHYQGLSKKFKHTIYCTQITANLASLKLGIPRKQLHILSLNVAVIVDGVEVTAVDANHCPGSVMLVFHCPKSGQHILHTGDFRFHHTMILYPPLRNKFHTLHLDTTYLNPSYNFPSQDDVVDFVRDVVRREAWSQDKTLVVSGSYTIGKEKVFMAAAQVLNCRIWASNDKQKVLCCLEDKELRDRLTSRPQEARVHVLPMQRLSHAQLRNHLSGHHFDKVVAFKPTGWTHSQGRSVADIRPVVQGNIHIYNVPYSEHSSFGELEEFVKFLVPGKVIPTVHVGSPASRNAMNGYIQAWIRSARNV